jgi:uncharacterized membrane protein (UPF0127 family)
VRPRFALPLLVLCLASCGGGNDVEGPRVVIETRDGEQQVSVEVADTDAERQRGLMERTSLPADAGMVFVFPGETAGGFWMKNTRIPLSIAFYAADGRIVRILDMEPCRRDPCPVYDPGVAYVGALEVNQGAFRRWNVSEGDRLRLELDK